MANVDILVKKRSALKAKLTNFHNYLSVILTCKSLSTLQRIELEGRSAKFDALFDKFDELQLEIEVLSEPPDEAYAERAKFEERFHSLSAQAHSLLAPVADMRDDESVAGSTSQTGGSKNFVRLPKIDLPTFFGGLESWLEYKDTFLSLIHNSSCIDDISKFHYLRASLKGNAQQVISNLDFKASNYKTAWNLLCERYDNSKLLVNNHLQALFNTEVILKESGPSLRGLIDVINKNTRALKTLNEPVEHWDTMIIYMMSIKLDPITNRDWEEYRCTLEKSPTLTQFCTYINNKADLLETIEEKANKQTNNNHKSYILTKQNSQQQNQQYRESNNILQCPMCSKPHLLYSCETFRGLPVAMRIAKVKEFGVCINCLRPNHTANRCKLSHCKYCKSKHNSMLHIEPPKNIQDPMPSVALPVGISDDIPKSTFPSENVTLSSNTYQQNATSSHILLSTALIKAVNDKGEKFDARLLLDNGSTANFVSHALCDKMGLSRFNTSSTVTGINNQTSISTQSCRLTIESNTSNYKANINCFVLPEVTKKLPTSIIDVSKIPIPSNLQLADPFFYLPSKIDILVGAEVFWNVLGSASIYLGKNNPRLCDTKLGWLVSGPVILATLSRATIQSHNCNFTLNELDSKLTKFWEIDSTFVRNRVSEIQETTAGHTWRYTDTKQNPGDIISSGLKADLIHDCSLWWSGPEFLSKDESHWPKIPNDNVKPDLSEIISSHVNYLQSDLTNQSFHQSQLNTESLVSSLIHKHSDINRLQRILAYIHRFIYNSTNKTNKIQGSLSTVELTNSANLIIKNAQLEMFKTEHNLLQTKKPLPRKNRLISLSPFIDNNNIIRVGGRLDNSPYDYNVKHPILLCSKHHFTKCLFQKEHVKLLHAGPQLLFANIRQKYWPLGGRNLSKSTVKRCVKCFRHKCQTVQPIMGQLPTTRTELEYPFLNCSVDYFGPVLISDRKGRGCKLIKSYVCIILCQAVKAAHIELVTELTKEAYMAALNRFVSRRGKPKSIMSDNAKNFVGTCNELQHFLQESDIAYDIAQQGIEFSFVPPYTPHFNGLAEAAVRSAKHHLKRLLQLTHFTFEEMSTCLTQIEAVLNSRPLTPFSSDPLDFTALTPAHFLIGRSLMSVPHPQVDDINITRLKRYQRIEHIKQHFWNRFQNEYVSLLQSKTKWTHSSEQQLSVGALVLIKEKGEPPLLWPMGRVTKVMPGGDNLNRVAELKTCRGTILRAFSNICPLPIT